MVISSVVIETCIIVDVLNEYDALEVLAAVHSSELILELVVEDLSRKSL